jgi:lysophospholipid acyltransferase (LPLAT)-like uncharacterized protein
VFLRELLGRPKTQFLRLDNDLVTPKGNLPRKILPQLGTTLVRFLFGTSRIQESPRPLYETLNRCGRPFIGAFWHSRLLYMPYYFSSPDHCAIISQHKDGEIAAQIVARFGVQVVRGSTTRGGSAALRTLLRLLRKGVTVGITPDGPKGPPRKVQTGSIILAQMSGRPIIPLTYSVNRKMRLRTWDRFVVPFPLSRGLFIHGTPIFVPSTSDQEQRERYRRLVEAKLDEITDHADREMGWFD